LVLRHKECLNSRPRQETASFRFRSVKTQDLHDNKEILCDHARACTDLVILLFPIPSDRFPGASVPQGDEYRQQAANQLALKDRI